MTFEKIKPFLDSGYAVRREIYNDSLLIYKQPSLKINYFERSILIPPRVLEILSFSQKDIIYESQYIIYDLETKIASHYIFAGEDIDADDWIVIK